MIKKHGSYKPKLWEKRGYLRQRHATKLSVPI